jgi:two-component system, LytTR family, response regulator
VKTLELNRSFLKKAWSGLAILFIIVLFYEIFSWIFNPEFKSTSVETSNGFVGYLLNWVIGFYLPEFVSLYILLTLIDHFHDVLGVNEIAITPKSIFGYELKFLPVFLIAYFFFIPITLHLRFFLREFPDFQASRYEEYYLVLLYTYKGYLIYTPFVVITGYVLLNISLFIDFLQNLKRTATPEETVFDAFASYAKGTPRPFIQMIEAKTSTGDTLLNVNDCYLFETEEGSYFVEHSKGRFTISKSLAELENELDPGRFFRGNRNFILNLNFFDSYTYWEKGKYILHSSKLPNKDLVMPRARMQNLKESLEKNLITPHSASGIATISPLAGSQGNS